MKRKEDDDKIVRRPMFPRLNIHDTEKGGPRAPPRNKMALYEHLTTPSKNSGFIPSTLKNKGTDLGIRIPLPLYQQSLPQPYFHDELHVNHLEAVKLSNRARQVENRGKPVEEDEVVVPVFSHHEIETTENDEDVERGTPQIGSHPMMILNQGNENTIHCYGNLLSGKHMMDKGRSNLRSCDSTKGNLGVTTREKDGLQQGQQDKFLLSNSGKTGVCSRKDLEKSLLASQIRFSEGASDRPSVNTQKDIASRLKNRSKVYQCRDVNEVNNGRQRTNDCSLEREHVDIDDDVSEISVVDSAFALDVSAEDVVGIMGVKHFLKARSAIASQQRLLADQVFELHRLMKVQGLIAGSPHILLEHNTFLNDTSTKDSKVKKYSSDLFKTFTRTIQEDDSQELKDKVEYTAENAASKVHSASAPTLVSPVDMDPKMNPWSFHQPSLHQWLVPVMCPSEGLVYKPCSASGFMGPVYGSYGPVGPYGYFPPYGLPVVSSSASWTVVDQLSKSSQPMPHSQMGCPTGGNTKGSCNGPVQKNETITRVRDAELQRSTASSTVEQEQGTRMAHFPTSVTRISYGTPAEMQSRVIRVVPRDRGSTRESVARIFQSIQEERRQQLSS